MLLLILGFLNLHKSRRGSRFFGVDILPFIISHGVAAKRADAVLSRKKRAVRYWGVKVTLQGIGSFPMET